MTDLSQRLQNLTPQQRKLLAEKLKSRDAAKHAEQPKAAPESFPKMDLSLFFFSADGTGQGEGKYDMLMECAKFADQNGFKAIWTPERHFQAFGGLYPNPSVLSAALAVITKNIRLRSGSVVLPLHSPVRIAEEWALVDNLSGGRVDLSFATGWHNYDYVIRPENFHDRRELMFRHIDTVRQLWRGETVALPGVDGEETKVSTLPRPVQKELPFWVTATSERTWKRAGEIGAGVLSTLGPSLEGLSRNVAAYRQARAQNGLDPRKGRVTIMLHTFLGDDEETTKDLVREPMHHYLRNFLNQYQQIPEGQKYSDPEALLEFAFERYYAQTSLLGTPEKCKQILARLGAAGVTEAACLVDFGLQRQKVKDSLTKLAEFVPLFSTDQTPEKAVSRKS